MSHTIIITPSRNSDNAPRHSAGGPLFDVSYHGQIIATATTEPCLAACRALKAMGITGKLEMWDDITPYVRLSANISIAAKKTIREGDEPPRLIKYVPFTPRPALDADLAPGATFAPFNAETPPLEAVAQSAGGAA